MPPRTANVAMVPARAWETWVREHDAVVLDVREPAEWAQGTLPGSLTVPLGRLPLAVADLDRGRPVLVVCRTGNRSLVAARFLAQAGFRAANLVEGLVALGLA